MESIFMKLEACEDLKEELRYWCRQNEIKVSFTINMTFSRAKSIFRKLENIHKKDLGKLKTRWLENELKLFHFALLAISVLSKIKICDFKQEQWEILNEAFPNKIQAILEYEAKNFIIDKSTLKLKWEKEEETLLKVIVNGKKEQPKWNEVAIELFIESKREFFRNGKQCRERWLNHLDDFIKHDKWTKEEDSILIKGVLEFGKKWSRIMKCFNNQRTEHMIKNRFLSLILRCQKENPFVQDEEIIIQKLAVDMNLKFGEKKTFEDKICRERKLRQNRITSEKVCRDELNENEVKKEAIIKDSTSQIEEKRKLSRKNSIERDPKLHINYAQCPSSNELKIKSASTLASSEENEGNVVAYPDYRWLLVFPMHFE